MNNNIVYIFAFIVGGLITLTITYFQMNGSPLVSRLMTLFPVFTWLSYIFIGYVSSSKAVASNARFVLLGTLFCWVPYMLAIYFFAPKIGTAWALVTGITTFLCLAFIFTHFYR